jgi:hypothetical protein
LRLVRLLDDDRALGEAVTEADRDRRQGSSLAGEQMAIRSVTACGGNCASVSAAADAAALTPAVNAAPSAKAPNFIFYPFPRI